MAIVRVINPTQIIQERLRVAAYARVSSYSLDQIHSFIAQINYYTKYIDERPDWQLVDIYVDEGITGTKIEKRDDFIRLINDCKKGKIDRIITKSISRFARNHYECISTVRMLKKYGVSIYFEEEDVDTATISSEITLSIGALSSQEASKTISKNMRWSYRKRMEKGEYVNAPPAYGYRLQNKTMLSNQSEESVVLRIYDLFLSGRGKQAIANILKSENVPKKDGKFEWHYRTVNYILNNERYIGDALFQKSYTTNQFPFYRKKNKGEMPQYYVENNHLPIINRDVYKSTQALQKLRKQDHLPPIIYPLTKKLICSYCGHLFRRLMVNGKPYWRCAYSASGKRNCTGINLPETQIYDAFILMVNKLTSHREQIILPMISELEKMQCKLSGTQNKIYLIDKEIANLNNQNLMVVRLYNNGILSTTDYTEQSNAINQKVSKLRSDRRKLLQQDESDEIINGINELNEILAETTNPIVDFDKDLFSDIVQSIAVHSNTRIQFKLIGGFELIDTIPYKERRIKK